MRALRTRLAWTTSGALAVVLAAGGPWIAARAERTLAAEFDETLRTWGHAALASVEFDPYEGLEFEPRGPIALALEGPKGEGHDPPRLLIEVPSVDVVARSPGLPDAVVSAARSGARGGDAQGGDGSLWRFVVVAGRASVDRGGDEEVETAVRKAVPDESPPEVVAVVAAPWRTLDRHVASLRLALLSTGLALLAAGVVSVLVAVRVGLAPLAEFAARVRTLEPGGRSEPLGRSRWPEELVPLARRLDELTRRVGEAIARERRFTAAAAHELRTPLSELRAALDVARKWPDDAQLAREALETARQVSERVTRLTRALLRLSRFREEPVPHERVPTDLLELARRAVEEREALARERDLEVRCAEGSLVHPLDPELAELLVENVVDNAISHALPGSSVRIERGERGALAVTNRHAGITAEDVGRLREPFFRADRARSDPAHAGLGLALASAAAEALGLDLRLHVEGDLFRAEIVAPPRATPP